ncbi:MAG: heme NO-binding domain-containing protein [Pseudomonadota bacterium]
MHGMICKSLETFLRTNHGHDIWAAVREQAEMDAPEFEAMQTYPDDLFLAVVAAAAERLGRPVSVLLEDVGTWICTTPPLEPVRRLIRFSGPTYEDLLWSLDEMHDRARLAVPDLDFPACRAEEIEPGQYEITVRWPISGAAAVMTGILRAMADDYGVLAMLDRGARRQIDGLWHEQISVTLFEAEFAPPRDFSIGVSA